MKLKNLASVLIVLLLCVLLVGCLVACGDKGNTTPGGDNTDDVTPGGDDTGDDGDDSGDTPAPEKVTVTVNATASKVWGESGKDINWEFSFEGAPEGSTLASLGLEGKVSVDDSKIPTALSVTTYEGKIEFKDVSDTELYRFEKGTAVLTVSKRPLTIEIGDQTVAYDPAGAKPYTDGTSVTFGGAGLADGNTITLGITAEGEAVLNAGESAPLVFDGSVKILNGAADVTKYYEIDAKLADGAKLNVTKAKPVVGIFVGPDRFDASAPDKTYSFNDFLEQIELPDGYTVKINDEEAAEADHSAGGEYPVTVELQGNENYEDQTVTAYLCIRTFRDDKGYWLSLSEAGAKVRETGTPLTIRMQYDTTVSSDTVIPDGLTVVLRNVTSTDKNDTYDTSVKVGNPTYASYTGHSAHADSDASFIERTLTVAAGAKLTVEGDIIVSGLLSTQSQPVQGHTSGNHSVLSVAGEVTVADGGVLDVRGYVRGEGKVTATSGSTVYLPFVVYDFKGGSATRDLYLDGEISPFNMFDIFYNLQADTRIESGASVISYLVLFASGMHNTAQAELVGEDNCFFILSDGAALEISREASTAYNRASGRNKVTFLGDVEIGDISLDIIIVTVNLSDVRVPLSQRFDWQVGDGVTESSLTMPDEYKLMPGARLVVSKNATLNVEGSLIVCTTVEDTKFASAEVYPFSAAPEFVVNGKFVIADGASFGGRVTSTESGAEVVTGASFVAEVTSVEGVGVTDTTFTMTFKITEQARFDEGNVEKTDTEKTYVYAANNSTVKYTERIRNHTSESPIEAGSTYTYDAATSAWTKA